MRPLAAAALAALLLLPGCVAVAAAAGAAAAYGYVRYDENEAYRDYRTDVDLAWQASMATLRQQGYRVRPGVTFADMRGRLELDDLVVTVTANSAVSSRVAVRVGTFSNAAHRDRAGAILDGIAVRLGE